MSWLRIGWFNVLWLSSQLGGFANIAGRLFTPEALQ